MATKAGNVCATGAKCPTDFHARWPGVLAGPRCAQRHIARLANLRGASTPAERDDTTGPQLRWPTPGLERGCTVVASVGFGRGAGAVARVGIGLEPGPICSPNSQTLRDFLTFSVTIFTRPRKGW